MEVAAATVGWNLDTTVRKIWHLIIYVQLGNVVVLERLL